MPRLPVGWPCFILFYYFIIIIIIFLDECQLQSFIYIYFAGVCVQIESGGVSSKEKE